MKKLYTYFLAFLVISTLTILFLYLKNTRNETTEINNSPYTLQVIEQDSSWIYEIKTKKDAEKIGNLVVSKLSKNVFPVISKDDLNDNNINFEHI